MQSLTIDTAILQLAVRSGITSHLYKHIWVALTHSHFIFVFIGGSFDSMAVPKLFSNGQINVFL